MNEEVRNYLKCVIQVAQALEVAISELSRDSYEEARKTLEDTTSYRRGYDILKDNGFDPTWTSMQNLAENLAALENLELAPKNEKSLTKGYVSTKSKDDTEYLFKCLEEIAQTKAMPIKQVSESKSTKSLVAIMVGDMHTGAETIDIESEIPIFNRDILKYSVDNWIDENIEICRNTKDLEEIVVCSVGDIVDGEGIYETQSTQQDITCVPDQVKLAATYIWTLLVTLKKEFPKCKVRFEGVKGNHGSMAIPIDPASNWDIAVYNMLLFARDLSGQDIDIHFTKGDFNNFYLQGLKVHMVHKAPKQAETSSGSDQFAGSIIEHECDLVFTGHFHSPMHTEYRYRTIFRNGSFKGKDKLSIKIVKGARPKQITLVLRNNKVYAEYDIEVR